MENNSMLNNHNNSKEDEQLKLPPGFRFYPTDEELITHYLYQKVIDDSFSARAMGEVDLNKCEPWDLPRRAKMGEKEWYFFCVRDRKYPTGLRTNRATGSGYWKATGKDREICRAKTLVGMRKTLVFYKGRAPKGTKTNWVMHEYRLEGRYDAYNLPKTAKSEWVICRVSEKKFGGKKVHISGSMKLTSYLPSLMDSSSPSNGETVTVGRGDMPHVTCFSKSMEEKKTQDEKPGNDDSNSFNTNSVFSASWPSSKISTVSALFSKSSVQNPIFFSQCEPTLANFECQNSVILISEQKSMSRALLETQGPDLKQSLKSEVSQDNGLSPDMPYITINPEMLQIAFHDRLAPSSSTGQIDLDCVWNY